MKRKFNLITSAIVLAMLLTGCGTSTTSSQKDSSSSNSIKTAKQHSSAKKTSSKNQSTSADQSSQAAQSSVSQSSNSSTSSTASSSSVAAKSTTDNSAAGQTKASAVNPAGSDAQRLTAFNHAIRAQLGSVLLPTTPGLSTTNGHLNVRYSGNASNYTIYYSVGYTAKHLNDPTLSSQTPYLILNKKTYASKTAAAQAIRHYDDSSTTGLPTVDLGHGLTGTIDAGAGQRYLTWQEGHWQLTVHAAAVNGEDPLPTAQHIVNLLEQYYLPAPDDRGTGTFEVSVGDGQRPQVLTWMRDNVVYTMEAHSTDTLVQMAASLK
ncbi:hypothetical protein ACLUWI_09070 [Limosilactobacillus mucosae]|uniref:hypothetical protein n=1 Tax=Limosilactobacillus mucosae TaxID=97478 RepID=UPI003996C016